MPGSKPIGRNLSVQELRSTEVLRRTEEKLSDSQVVVGVVGLANTVILSAMGLEWVRLRPGEP